MAITGDALLITLRYEFLAQKCQTAQYYTPSGATFITANCDGVGNAWWQDVKDAWRDLINAASGDFLFKSVLVEEFNGSGGLGEYAIPIDEQLGTRPGGATSGFLPSYCACGVRLSVPTRNTRPGQKRFPGLIETDVLDNEITSDYIDLVEALSAKYDSAITLGAPVAAGLLTPIIIKYTGSPPAEAARQDVTGHVINSSVTSQVSRRKGHGS